MIFCSKALPDFESIRAELERKLDRYAKEKPLLGSALGFSFSEKIVRFQDEVSKSSGHNSNKKVRASVSDASNAESQTVRENSDESGNETDSEEKSSVKANPRKTKGIAAIVDSTPGRPSSINSVTKVRPKPEVQDLSEER